MSLRRRVGVAVCSTVSGGCYESLAAAEEEVGEEEQEQEDEEGKVIRNVCNVVAAAEAAAGTCGSTPAGCA